jgi:raffinose/stachyose/melibiose transport system permease protein
MTLDNRLAAPILSLRAFLHRKVRRETFVGWLFILPALAMYALFVLTPLVLTIKYSFYKWNGVTPAIWVGLKNYLTIFQVPDLIGTIYNAFLLVV